MKLQNSKSGFTLVEILVVLSIAALLSTILFAAFRSVRDGNKKASCQNNLVQIYQATRLYSQDFNGKLPYFNPSAVETNNPSNPPQNGLGLWALYGYPASNNLDCDGLTSELPDPRNTQDTTAPMASYIKTPRLFHCPYDSFGQPVNGTQVGCGVPSGTVLQSDQLQYTDAGGGAHLNPFYLSYQRRDDSIASTENYNQAIYSSFRAPTSKRQLLYYKGTTAAPEVNTSVRSADTTIITWCRFHRDLTADGGTEINDGNFDNVLFADGTVQYIPTRQRIGSATCEGWQRLPIEVANRAPYNTATACPTN